jgi:hypothetical protein
MLAAIGPALEACSAAGVPLTLMSDLPDPLLHGSDLVRSTGADLEADQHGAVANLDLLDEARGHDVLVEARPGHGSERLPHLLGGRTPHRPDLPCEAPWAIPEDTADRPPTLTD